VLCDEAFSASKTGTLILPRGWINKKRLVVTQGECNAADVRFGTAY